MSTLIYFIIYGLSGWLIDTSYRSLLAGQFSPGTWLPFFSLIYPIGALLIVWLDRHLLASARLWQQFLVFAMTATALEYVSGHIGLFVLGRRLWDYSDMPFNVGGFIDLFHAIAWGLLSLFLVHMLHPRLQTLMDKRHAAGEKAV